MRRRVLTVVVLAMVSLGALAQGTKLWKVDRYDEMERGLGEGVAIRSDGQIGPGPATSLLYRTSASYIWSVAVDAVGSVYAGMGGTSAGTAIVMRVGKDGKAERIFEGKELGVQAVRVGPDGSVFVATSPDGKVYRLGRGGAAATVVFDPSLTQQKPKYLWDMAVGRGGELYVAAGAPAVVYRVPTSGGRPEVLFKTADQHIRCLLLALDGTLWAGSDGAGVIYRISTSAKGARPFAVYAAPKREITSLAMDAQGNLFAAGVGAKAGGATGSGLPPLQVTNEVGVSITFSQPGSTSAAGLNSVVPEGSELYRIAVDGTPERLVSLKDDVVYALAVRDGALVAASGNRGRIYRVAVDGSGQFTDAARLDAAQGTAMIAVGDGLLVGTSNSGKIFKVADAPASDAVYLSEVFDAQQFSRWGRAEVQSATADRSFDVYLHSGNVPSPVSGWSDWVKIAPNEGSGNVPAGRYVQWKAVLRPGGGLQSVGLNYLPRNVAPVVDEVVVAPGARVTSTNAIGQPPTVQVVFPAAASVTQAISYVQDANAAPLTAQKDRTSVTVRWAAHDDNGDDLMYAVWYRGTGEATWRLLKDKISERFLSFDSSLLPDGSYSAKVVASDAPVHTDAEALTGSRTSAAFTVDTTPPVPGALTARMEAGKIHAMLEARDVTSPIAHAEYSVDAGPWQYVEPVGALSDSLIERYDFVASAEQTGSAAGSKDATEHVLAMRIYDRFENMVSVKAMVR